MKHGDYYFLHSLWDERKCGHRFSYLLEKEMEKQNKKLIRFDYDGTGESEGEFCDVTVESLRHDVDQWIGDGAEGLIGVRFGASLAFDYAVRRPGRVKRLVLLEPILSGAGYVEQVCRRQRVKDRMTGDMDEVMNEAGYINIEGYKTSDRLIAELETFDLFTLAGKAADIGEVEIFQISDRKDVHPVLRRFGEQLRSAVKEVDLYAVEFPRFWERITVNDYASLVGQVRKCCHG